MGKTRKIGKKWQIDFREKGKRIRRIVGTSKAVAETILKDIEVRQAKEESGLYIKRISIDDFVDQCIAHTKLNHRPKTAVRYIEVLNYLKSFIAEYYPHVGSVSEITPDILESYKHKRSRKASGSTINTELKAINAFLNLAISWGYLRENPLKKVSSISLSKNKIPRFYSKDEVKKILNHSPDPYHDIFKVLLHTGMRRDELRFLEVQDIDLKRSRIHIKVKDGFAPKTSERTIPIHKAIMPILRDRIAQGHPGLIFPNKKGKLYEPRKWWKVLKKICKEIEIPDAKIHTFRHTFASWLVMSGVDITTVSRLLGHTDIRTTMIYAHLAEDHLDDSIKKLNI